MKVLMVNGSSKPNGCTATALQEIAKVLREEGIDSEIVCLGGGPLRDCGGLAGDSGRRGWGGGPHYPVRPGGPLSQKVRSPEGIGPHTTAARCIADAPRRFCFRSAPAGAPAATAARS